jgi:hypothetical protein
MSLVGAVASLVRAGAVRVPAADTVEETDTVAAKSR